MILLRFSLLFALLFSFQHCTETSPAINTPLNAEYLPSNAGPLQVNIYNVNSWVEKDRFFVTGVCSNISANWQRFWLDVVPVNAAGKAIAISNHTSVIVPTFSDAVPPQGRTSFFASWPLTDFSGKPDSCIVKLAGAVQQTAGPILAVPGTNGIRMFASSTSGLPATEETAWQLSGNLLNALDMEAAHPRLEILLYGKDNKLWLSTVLNPEDPATKPIFQFDREGPLQPKESRAFSLQVYYTGLPEALNTQKIGRIDILPFVAR